MRFMPFVNREFYFFLSNLDALHLAKAAILVLFLLLGEIIRSLGFCSVVKNPLAVQET